MSPARLAALLLACLIPCLSAADTLRVASFNAELQRDGPGLLLRDIGRGDDPQIAAVAEVIARAALTLGPGAGCDLVFLDPPYGRDLGARALAAAARAGRIAPGALIVWEEAQAMAAPDGFEALDQRRYGDTHMTLLRWRGEGE